VANLKKTFGQRLRELRDAKGLTQEELGRQVGIDYKHLGAIERGIKAPSFEVVDRLARALRVEHYKLFLPVNTSSHDIESDLQAVIADLGTERRTRIQRFFQEALRLMRRLDQH
jgi:putative transcriptional regulator